MSAHLPPAVRPSGPPMPSQAMPWPAELAHHAADEILRWCEWHISRAEARGLNAAPELGAVIAAAGEVAFALADGDVLDALDAAGECLHAAIDEAKWKADERKPHDAHALAQSIEVETSYLRGWARALVAIGGSARMASEAPEYDHDFHIQALRDLTFFAPPRFAAVREMAE